MAKTKKQKIIIAVIAVVIAAAVSVTSVLIINKKNNDAFYDSIDDSAPQIEYDKNYIDPNEAESLFELDYTEPEPIAHNKKLDKAVNADMSDYIDELSKKVIEFEYKDYYETEKHIKELKPLKTVKQHKYDITNGTGVVDEDVLYDTIVKNNNKYLDSFKKQKDDADAEIQLYEKASKKDVKRTCKYIAKYVNKAAKSKDFQDVDFDRVYCNLASLKILKGINPGFALAFIDENNIVNINSDNLENSKEMIAPDMEMSDAEMEQFAWDTTLVHEIMHLLQDVCPCTEEDNEYRIGNMQSTDDDATCPLLDLWYVEASAELETANMLGGEPVTYFNYINYYYSFLSAYYLSPDISPKKIMRLTFDSSCYPFYKAFGDLDEKETVELVNAMYCVEVMTNDPDGFITWYKDAYGTDLREREDEQELVHQKLRVEALKYCTKQFYISLAKQIEEGKMSYNDMFCLIRLYERDLYEHLLYDKEDRAMTSNIFFDDYLTIQDSFFEAVASDYISKDELKSEYEKYTNKCKDGKNTVDNFSLDWMSKEQKYALSKIEENYVFINLPTIRGAKAFYVENGYDKSEKY